MLSAPVELDFFPLERESLPTATTRRKTFRDIQRAVSKLNPEVLKSIIASVDRKLTAVSLPGTPKVPDNFIDSSRNKAVPVASYDDCAKQTSCAQMTIFYNGTVMVFDVSQHQAENILQLAQRGVSKTSIESKPLAEQSKLLDSLTKDLPVARKKSLQHFLEKRKERITLASSPYGNHSPTATR